MNKKQQELRKLHKLIIHNHNLVSSDKEWYHLARKETKQIDKITDDRLLSAICTACFGSGK